jgi:hypothetical protein
LARVLTAWSFAESGFDTIGLLPDGPELWLTRSVSVALRIGRLAAPRGRCRPLPSRAR